MLVSDNLRHSCKTIAEPLLPKMRQNNMHAMQEQGTQTAQSLVTGR